MRTAKRAAGTDALIQELAAAQHGVVSRDQLRAVGVTRRAVDRRIEKQVLRPVHRGVFQVGPVVAPLMREMAACLACGAAAMLSHRSAAALWQLLPTREPLDPVDVLVCGRERRHAGVRVRRTGTLRPEECTRLEGIPVTTPLRTLRDLSASVSTREMELAYGRALARGLITREGVDAALARAPMRGGRTLHALVAGTRPALTRSEAEERLLALVRKAGLPQPEVNVTLAGFEVDFFWRDARLVAEVDGFSFHADRHAFERDRQRDLVLAASGMRVVRITWRQLAREYEAVLARLAQALAPR